MKILVANRGEIALRIMRTCREMGLPSVAVYSEGDQKVQHTRYADESVFIGPTQASESYLNSEHILEAARQSGAQAIHPGYGFLSENAPFAQAVEEAGLSFIGPRAETIALTGDKLAARRAARQVGLPVLPGPDEPLQDDQPGDLAGEVTFPVLVKAVSGGGGRGIRLANSRGELVQMVAAARQEAQAAFGDNSVYLEPLVQRARHIEVQILGDGQGGVLCLGERECSIQRRRQKLIEEAPAPNLSRTMRKELHAAAIRLGCALKYRSLGTVEFLLDDQGAYYFIEVNPRIQVEHPVTEMVTGIDLVRAQLELAQTGKLKWRQDQIIPRGWAVEARVLAEDPDQGFLPVTGEITYLQEPAGPGVRLDSALFLGMWVSPDYDSLIAKVIAWAEDRPAAIQRLLRALGDYQIGGIPTDIDFLEQVLESPIFKEGQADTTYLDTFHPAERLDRADVEREVALAAALLVHRSHEHDPLPCQEDGNNWQNTAWREQM
jgi:acetyl-CoA carboxylase, biotin carboxylase subunit